MSSPSMVRLRDLGEWSGGNTPSKANPDYWANGTVPWVSPKDMKVDEITSSEDRVSKFALTDGRVSLVPEGSVLLVTRSGILAHTLPVAITTLPVTINQDLKALIPKAGVSAKYVVHALRSASRHILEGCSKNGTTVASIETDRLLDFKIPMVDFGEQRRIVAEIEKQFSRLDEAVANLRRVGARLKRFKGAILAVKTCIDREALPIGWRWSTVGELAAVGTGATPKRDRVEYWRGGTVPWVSSAVVNNLVVASPTELITELALKETNCRVYPPGTLLVAMYGEGKTRGMCAELGIAAATNQALAAIQVSEGIRPYLKLVLQASYERTRRAASGGVQPNLNLSHIRAIRVPLPSEKELHQIVEDVDRRLSVISEVAAEVDSSLKRVDQLRNAVLQRAFVGDSFVREDYGSTEPKAASVEITSSRRYFTRAVLSAEIVHRLHTEPTFGRVKHQKIFHLCEHIARLEEIQGQYHREAAGPLDNKVIYANTAELKRQKWYEEVKRDEFGRVYRPLAKAGQHERYLSRFTTEQMATIGKLIERMRTWNTERCEIFSTIYAAWNDLMLWGRPITDEAILHEVLNSWHDSKRRIGEARWRKAIGWIQKEGFAPTGFGKPTRREAK